MKNEEVRPPAAVRTPQWCSRSLRDHLDRELARALRGPAALRILDLSCGCDEAIAGLRARHPGWSWTSAAETSSASESGANAFDAVVVCGTRVASLEQPEAFFRDVFRALRPGGIALVDAPAHAWLASPRDASLGIRRRLAAPALKAELSAAGFRGIQTTHWNALASPALWLGRRFGPGRGRTGDAWYASLPLGALMFVEHGWIRLGSRWPFGEFLFAVARKPLASDVAGPQNR